MAAAAMAGGAGAGLGGLASEVLGLKSTSDVFVGVLAQPHGARQTDPSNSTCKKLYGDSRMEDARKDLAAHTSVSVERKSQIISIMVVDHSRGASRRNGASLCGGIESAGRGVEHLFGAAGTHLS